MSSENTELPDWVEVLDWEATEYWEEMGYGKVIKINDEIVGLYQFLFTVAIVVGLDMTGYRVRYCYNSANEAFGAMVVWVLEGGEEPSGYIVRKG